MCLTLKDLKELALQEGLIIQGRKRDLALGLEEQLNRQIVVDYLAEKDVTDRYLQPYLANPKSLKQFIWAETRRLELYAKWVAKVECQKEEPPRRKFTPIEDYEEERHYDPMAPDPYEPGILDPVKIREYAEQHPTEIRLVKKFWDSNCDAILRELVEQYAWYIARFICDAIEEYLPPQVLQSFVDDCSKHRTSNWSWTLKKIAEVRILELGINIPKPRVIDCAGCGITFSEWSIEWPIRERVNQRILFCKKCYQVACFHYGRATAGPLDKQEMLKRLNDLAGVLETIPTVSYMKKPDLASLSDDKLIEVVRTLLKTPSYSDYVEQFGSWYQALIDAGVLQEGTQKTSRGYRCIANDGHECFSIPEKTIDDWLSKRGISHEKEPSYPYDTRLNPTGFRADWLVGDILIEYAGMMDDPDYAAKMQVKQELARRYDVPLIILELEDLLTLDTKLGNLVS